MNFSSSADRSDKPLVLDTSALINLRESGVAIELLSAISNRIVITHIVENEFQRGSRDKNFLPAVLADRSIESLEFMNFEEEKYFELITELDDGESATIALAGERNWIPVLDESKGRSILSQRYPHVIPKYSLDVVMHQDVLSKLGKNRRDSALYAALKLARMRVPEDKSVEIISILGREKASECTSIANFRLHFPDVALKLKSNTPIVSA